MSHISLASELLARELTITLVVAAIGAPLALALPVRDRVVRVALAPALGFALTVCILMAASVVMTMTVAAWVVLLPLLVLSLVLLGIKLKRHGITGHLNDARSALLTLGPLAAAVTIPFNYILYGRFSLGPVAYRVGDIAGYLGEAIASKTNLSVGLRADPSCIDFAKCYWVHISDQGQQVGTSVFLGALTELTNWRVVDTQSSFFITLVIVGALSSFALVRYITSSNLISTCYAWLAGMLFAGALVIHLFLEGSQSAIAGLAILPATLLIAQLFYRARSIKMALFLGLAFAAYLYLYPIYVPILVISGLLLLVGVYLWRKLSGVRTALTERKGSLLRSLLVAVIACAVFAPVAIERAPRMLTLLEKIRKDPASFSFPNYDLPLHSALGWLLQLREIYFLPRTSEGSLAQWLLIYLAPLVLVAIASYGAVHFKRARYLLVVPAVAIAVNVLSGTSESCSYCVYRNLLIVMPVVAILTAVGLLALARSGNSYIRLAGVVLTVTFIVLVGFRSKVVTERAIEDAYVPGRDVAHLAEKMRGLGGVDIEGIGQSPKALIELPTTYYEVYEITGELPSMDVEANDANGLAYFGGPRPNRFLSRQEGRGFFLPNYRYVLTRLGSIKTARRTLDSSGPYALERVSGPLDISITSGVAVDQDTRDRAGHAWVQGPLIFLITNRDRRPRRPREASVRLSFEREVPFRVSEPRTAVLKNLTRTRSEVCVQLVLKGNLQRLAVNLDFAKKPDLEPPPGRFQDAVQPHTGVRLSGMQFAGDGCGRQ